MSDIKRMAREAGMLPALGGGFTFVYGAIPVDMLTRFAALVRAQALEDAARACDDMRAETLRLKAYEQAASYANARDAVAALKEQK